MKPSVALLFLLGVACGDPAPSPLDAAVDRGDLALLDRQADRASADGACATQGCPAEGATECADGALRSCARNPAGCLEWGTASPCPSRACASATACADRPIWFVQISDLHFGGAPLVGPRLALVVQELVPTILPVATFNTGDTVEEGGDSPWDPYVKLAEGKLPPYPEYLEIPGNHDLKNNGSGNYLLNTVTGKAGGGTYGDALLASPVGTIRILRSNTSDGSSNPINVVGFFGEKQRDALLALTPPPSPPRHTVVLGHHPLSAPFGLQVLGTDGNMKKVIDGIGGELYLCGHVHSPWLSFHKKTLVVQASSLGKSDPPTLMLVGIDPSGPSVLEVPLTGGSVPTVAWPLVLITSPADAKLGGTNPHAMALSAATAFPVRVLTFGPSPIQSVEARLDMGSWQALADAGGNLWTGTLQPSKGGTQSLEVRATAKEGTGGHAVTVEVGP